MSVKLKIRGKLVVSFTVVIGMVLTALGIITYLTFAESIQNNKEEIAHLHIKSIEDQLNSHIGNQLHELKELSLSLPLLSSDEQLSNPQIELIESYLESNGDISDISISTQNGRIIFSSSPDGALTLLDYLQGDSNSEMQVVTEEDGVWLVVPHGNTANPRINQYAVQLKVGEIMSRLLADTSLNEAKLNIFKGEKRIYTSGDSEIGDARKHTPTTVEGEAKKLFLVDDYYVLHATQEQLGWDINVLLPERVILEDLVNLKNRLIAAVIVVLWTSIWIVLIVAHRISQPIRTLSQATQDIQDFNYSTPIEFPLTHDEISDLAASFESMRVYIKGQVSRDPLTNLNNRRYMMHAMGLEMAKALRTQQSISVVMVDLDHFKAVNDTYGHQGGDHILMETAKVLMDGVRQYDIAARYGGEEFALVLPFTDGDGALIVAERIRIALMQKEIEWDGQEVNVTMSVGIATFQFDETVEHSDVERITYELFENADEALYRAKEGGRNRCEIYHREGGTATTA